MNIIKKIAILLTLLLFTSCNAIKPKKVDTRKVPVDARERALKNIKEGKGINLGGVTKRSTTYQFSTSNPMWRASLEVLDFLPLSTVDYSGGVIITDWYNDNNSKDSIKVTVRFLSNEIRTNSLKVSVHKKTCNTQSSCVTSKIESKIEEELIASIMKNAVQIEKDSKNKKKK